MFADEPTGNLDSRASAEILAFLRRSVDEFGQSIVMVTHDPVAASAVMAHPIGIMDMFCTSPATTMSLVPVATMAGVTTRRPGRR